MGGPANHQPELPSLYSLHTLGLSVSQSVTGPNLHFKALLYTSGPFSMLPLHLSQYLFQICVDYARKWSGLLINSLSNQDEAVGVLKAFI